MRGPRITLEIWSLAGVAKGGRDGSGWAGGSLGARTQGGVGSQVSWRQGDICEE